MREIALHLLDIAENSVAAQARTIQIQVCEDLLYDRLVASVQDDGRGMDAGLVERVIDPFVTSRTTRKVGLGLPLLKAAAEGCNGHLKIESEVGRGARVEVEFQHSHIDRMPLGDLAGTLLTLVVAYPPVHWLFTYSVLLPGAERDPERVEFSFDDEPVKAALGDLPLCEPAVLAFVRETLEQGIAGVRQALPEPEFFL